MSSITVDGRLGADVELAFSPSGQARATFPLAEQHRKKSPSGEWVDDSTSWYRVTVWGKRAETLADALSKGQPVLVTGDLKIAEYETRDGGKGKSAEINARTVAVVPVPGQSQPRQQVASGGQVDDPWATGGFADSAPF